MTVADNTSRNQYTATSGQTVFAYTFEIVDKDDIVVLKNGTTLSEGTNYTVSNVGNDSGGNVTLTSGATAGDILTLYRDMPYARTQNYTNSGDFLASEVNSDFDNLWLAGEQTNRSFSQSIRKPITDSDSISMELPAAADRAGRLLSFTGDGSVSVATSATNGTTANLVTYSPAGTGAVDTTVEAKLREGISIKDYGAVGDGTTDDTAAINAAITEAKASEKSIFIPYGEYLVTSTLDFFRVSVRGEFAADQSDFATTSHWPVIKGGPSLTEIIRVGQASAGSDLNDFSVIENLMIDMTSSPTNAKGIYCEYGLIFKTIRNIYVRAATETTTSAIVAKNHTAYHFAMSDSASQGLYYLQLDNLTAFNCFRGFYTSGDANDGMRVCDIGRITIWNCPQAITFKDTEANSISLLGIQSFLTDYDPSGATPTEWGIWMDNSGNNIDNVYIEGVSDATSPHSFITGRHSINHYRDLATVPNSIQTILEDGTRVVASRAGNNRSLLGSDEMTEVGTLGGTQAQQPVNVNSMFEFWTGGSTNIGDNTEFAYSWKSVKAGTGTLRLTQRTGSSGTETYNSGINLEITTPQVDRLYGAKQDLADFYPLSGSLLDTLARNLEYLTICVQVRPYSTNPSAMRFRIETDTGVATTSENYKIAYDPATSGVDEKITGATGNFWSLIHQVNLGNITKCEIKAGIYPEDTNTYGCDIDAIFIIAGRHTQYGARPYIHAPKYLKVPEGNANTNTPSGATAHAVPIFNYDGSLLGYIPVYGSTW